MTTSLLIIAGLFTLCTAYLCGWKAAAHFLTICGLIYITAVITLSL